MISTIACPGSFISLYKQMYLETQTCHILAKSLFFSIFQKLEKPQWLMFIISGPVVAKWVGGRIPGSDGWQDFSGQNVKDLSLFFSFCGFFFFFLSSALAKHIYKVVTMTGHQSSVCNIAKGQSTCPVWTLITCQRRMASGKYEIFFPTFFGCTVQHVGS